MRSRLRSETALGSLTPLIAFALASCGGGGGGGASGDGLSVVSRSGRVFDGPIDGARVYVDVNENGRIDAGDRLVGMTNRMGRFSGEVSQEFEDKPYVVDLRNARDIGDPDVPGDGTALDGGVLRAPAGSAVINPVTHLLETMTDSAQREALASSIREKLDVDIRMYDPYASDINSDVSAERDKANAVISFTEEVFDEFRLGQSNRSSIQNIQQRINKILNDAPVVVDIPGVTITDTTAVDTSFDNPTGTFTVTDPDPADTYSFMVAGAVADVSVGGFTHRVNGDYGDLFYNTDSGAWRYVVNASAVDALADGDTETDSFTVTARDLLEDSSNSQNLVITINGADENVAPVFPKPTGGTVNDTPATDTSFEALTGSFGATDSGAITYSVPGQVVSTVSGFTHMVTGTYGVLHFNENSETWRYVVTASAVNDLAGGASAMDSFAVTATDTGGLTTSQNLDIAINGVDEAALVVTAGSSDDTSVTLDLDDGGSADNSASGRLTATRHDLPASGASFSGTGAQHGTFNIDNDGNWTYTLTASSLPASTTDTITVMVSQGGSPINETITINITVIPLGASNIPPMVNAIPGVTINDTTAVDASFTDPTGTFTVTDPGDTDHTFTVTGENSASAVADAREGGFTHRVNGDYGDLFYNSSTGAWRYVVDVSAVDGLAGGVTETDTFTVRARDDFADSSNSQDLVITVTGADEYIAPTIEIYQDSTDTVTIDEHIDDYNFEAIGIELVVGVAQDATINSVEITAKDTSNVATKRLANLLEADPLGTGNYRIIVPQGSSLNADGVNSVRGTHVLLVTVHDSNDQMKSQEITVTVNNIPLNIYADVGDFASVPEAAHSDDVIRASEREIGPMRFGVSDGGSLVNLDSSSFTVTAKNTGDAAADALAAMVASRLSVIASVSHGSETYNLHWNENAIVDADGVNSLAGTHQLTVTVTYEGESDSIDVELQIRDINDEVPEIAGGNSFTARVAEDSADTHNIRSFNEASGVVVPDVAGVSYNYTYALNDVGGNGHAQYFMITPDGHLRRKGATVFDFESSLTNYDVMVVVNAEYDGRTTTSSQRVSINLDDADDVTIAINREAGFTVPSFMEGATITQSTTVYDAMATATDDVTNADYASQIVWSLDDDHNGLFAIDSNGVVTVTRDVDPTHGNDYALVIRASVGASSSTHPHTVSIAPAPPPNIAPTLAHASGGTGAVSVGEDATGTQSGTLSFGDADEGDTNSALTIRFWAKSTADTDPPDSNPSIPTTPASLSSLDRTLEAGSSFIVAGRYGIFTLTRNDSTGVVNWTYDLNEGSDVVQALSDNDEVHDVLYLQVDDGSAENNKSSVQAVVATITGDNDALARTAATISDWTFYDDYFPQFRIPDYAFENKEGDPLIYELASVKKDNVAISTPSWLTVDQDGLIQVGFAYYRSGTYTVELRVRDDVSTSEDAVTISFDILFNHDQHNRMISQGSEVNIPLSTYYKRYRLVNDLDWVEIVNNPPAPSYMIVKPTDDEVGMQSIRIFDAPGKSLANVTHVNLEIVNINDAPEVVESNLENWHVSEGSTDETYTLRADALIDRDLDSGDRLTYSAKVDGNNPDDLSWIEFNADTQTFRLLQSDQTLVGQHNIEILATDSFGASGRANIILFIQPSETTPDTPANFTQSIHELHPLNKDVYKFELPSGQTPTLAAGMEDNDLFTIDGAGRLRWKALVDYETPTDRNWDNIYRVVVNHGATNTVLDITVQDIANEVDGTSQETLHNTGALGYSVGPNRIPDQFLPSTFAQYILAHSHSAWVMPASGPLVLTWSFFAENLPSWWPFEDSINPLDTQAEFDHVRGLMERAFDYLETLINVQFVEVQGTDGSNDGRADINIAFRNTDRDGDGLHDGFIGGRAFGPPATINTSDSHYRDQLVFYVPLPSDLTKWDPDYPVPGWGTVLEEIIHTLGLKDLYQHHFNRWLRRPDDYDHYADYGTLLGGLGNTDRGGRTALKIGPTDIEALQFLYGPAGGDWRDSIEQYFVHSPTVNQFGYRGAPKVDGHAVVDENISAGTTGEVVFRGAPAEDTNYHTRHSRVDGSTVFSFHSGANDNDLFILDSATGDIRFKVAPDYENPLDGSYAQDDPKANNNVYYIQVTENFDLQYTDGTRTIDGDTIYSSSIMADYAIHVRDVVDEGSSTQADAGLVTITDANGLPETESATEFDII